MNLHKGVGRSGYLKQRRLVLKGDASYPGSRKRVEGGALRRQRSIPTASLFAAGAEGGQGYEGSWRTKHDYNQAKIPRRRTYKGRKPVEAGSGNGRSSAREAAGSGCSC